MHPSTWAEFTFSVPALLVMKMKPKIIKKCQKRAPFFINLWKMGLFFHLHSNTDLILTINGFITLLSWYFNWYYIKSMLLLNTTQIKVPKIPNFVPEIQIFSVILVILTYFCNFIGQDDQRHVQNTFHNHTESKYVH